MSGLLRLEVFLLDLSLNTLVSSSLGLFVSSLSGVGLLFLSTVFLNQLKKLVLRKWSTTLGEKFNNLRPVTLLCLHLSLHTVKDLLESFTGNPGVAFWVSSHSCINCTNLRVLSHSQEEGQNIDLVLQRASSWHTIKDVLDQLELFLLNVNLISFPEFGQLLHPSLLLLLHERLHVVLALSFVVFLHGCLGGLGHLGGLFVTSIDVLVVVEVVHELSPSQEFFVVDRIF